MRTLGMTALGVLSFLLLIQVGIAQEEKQTWQWSPTQKYHESTVKIWQDGNYTGSGVVIGTNQEKTLGYVLTAFHVIIHDDYAGIEWKDNKRSAGKIILRDDKNDLAIVTCDPPENVVIADIANRLPAKGEVCDHTGWGGKEDIILRTFYGQYMHTEDSTYTNTSAIEGDSGGGVWYKGKLIGIISGGRYQTSEDLRFPVRSASLDSIQRFCNRVNALEPNEVIVAQSSVPPNYFEFLGEVPEAPVPSPTTIQKENGNFTVVPPTPPKIEKKEIQETANASVPQTIPKAVQIVGIDTKLLAQSVVDYISKHNMIPEQKINDGEQIIRIAERLKRDTDFADLVAEKILDKVEKRVLERIGKVITDEAK